MKWCSGQIVSLSDIREGKTAGVNMQIHDELFHMGQEMEVWFFDDESAAVKFDCFIVGFEILAGQGVTPITAVQIAESPYYAVIAQGSGLLCKPTQIDEELLEDLRSHHRLGGLAMVVARLEELYKEKSKTLEPKKHDPSWDDRARRNMEFTHTRAPVGSPPARQRPRLQVIRGGGQAADKPAACA